MDSTGRRSIAGRLIPAVVAVFLLAAGSSAAATRSTEREPAEKAVRTGRAIVLLGHGGDVATVADRFALRRAGRQPARLGALTIDIPPGGTVAALRELLVGRGGVVRVEPEYRRFLRSTPDDPGFGRADPNAPNGDIGQWNLRREGFEAAWDLTQGERATVAIVDRGVDTGHPEFSGRIRAAVDQDPTPLAPGADTDTVGHGTHVAGLACADAGNGYGIAGAGHDCGLIVEKTDLSDSSIAAAITDAANRGADVINMSLGGPGEATIIRRAIDYALERDVVLVAAATNEATEDQGIPAEYLQSRGTGSDLGVNRGLVVTNAGYDGNRVAQAGFGSGVSIAAFGDSTLDKKGILSTWPGNSTEIDSGTLLPPSPPCFCRTAIGSDDRFAYLFGTSMATPQVAGAAALLRSLNPRLTAPQVVRAIKEGTGKAYSSDLGWGLLNAAGAVAKALPLESDPPASSVRSTRRVRSRAFTLKISASDPVADRVPASGVDRVRIFYARQGRSGYRVLRTVPARELSGGRSRVRFRGSPGHSYRFYTRAVDRAGNEEAAPGRADSVTSIKRRR